MHGQPAIPWWLPWTIEGTPSEEEATAERPSAEEGLRERVVERDNRLRARKQVQSHGGSPGREGMTVAERAPARKEPGRRVKPALGDGTELPQPVQRVDVPNPPGGLRKRGVPTVVDRCIPPAGRPGLQAPGEPTCSAARVGFRPGGNAQHAVKRAPSYRNEGDPGVGERDREKVCARVHHDTGMRAVAKGGRDRRVLTWIHRVLKAGAMAHEARQETVDGVPHGGPRSPLRSNLLLDRRDREWERRGPRCGRDAEDRHGYVRRKRAGYRG
jgi:RNA-directed DNA polymerase